MTASTNRSGAEVCAGSHGPLNAAQRRCHPAAEPWPIHGGRRQLEIVLSHCPFDESQLAEDGGEFESESFLDLFLFAKRLEGCSDRSIFYYEATIKKMLESFDAPACDLETEEIRSYFSNYQQKAGVTHVTVDNVRRIISSFYSWLEDEDHIIKSPVKRIKRVKAPQLIRETYGDKVARFFAITAGCPETLP